MGYRHYSKLFRKLRKESEFRQRCCRNSTKVWERKRKNGREKILNFGNHITETPACRKPIVAMPLPKKGKKNFVAIVAMPLPKMRGKKNNKIMIAEIWWGIKKKKMLRPQYFYNIFTTNHRWIVIISSNLNLTLRLLF